MRPPPEKDQPQLQNSGADEQIKDTEASGVNGDVFTDATATRTAENGKAQGIGVSSLAAGESQWLDPSAQMPFVPWPTEEVIRRGALAQIQVMLEQGIDPAEAPKELQEETKPEVEVDIKHEGDVAAPVRRESTSAGPGRVDMKREEKPAVFGGLDLYDPDDE